jgi:hypothetical protein
MGDSHQPLGEQVASVALRPEAALAPQDECPQFPLGVVIRLRRLPEMTRAYSSEMTH